MLGSFSPSEFSANSWLSKNVFAAVHAERGRVKRVVLLLLLRSPKLFMKSQPHLFHLCVKLICPQYCLRTHLYSWSTVFFQVHTRSYMICA